MLAGIRGLEKGPRDCVRHLGLVPAIGFLVIAAYGRAIAGQQVAAPVSSASQNSAPRQLVQTEMVTVTRNGAFPAHIERRPGAFFLLLVSAVPDSQLNVAFIPAIPVTDPLKIRDIIDVRSLQKKRLSAGLVDLLPGEYYLQSLPAQRTICTITIR